MTTAIPDELRASLTVVSEETFAGWIGVHANTAKAMRRSGTGPPALTLSPGRIGYRITDIQRWLDLRAQAASLPTPEQRAAAQAEVSAFIGAMLAKNYAAADQIIPASINNVHALELAGLLLRLLESEHPAELMAELRQRVLD